MASMTKRVHDRLVAGLGKYQPLLALAREESAGTARTAALVNDLLHEVFGYRKLFEISPEPMLRGPLCDFALVLAETVALLVKVKPAADALADHDARALVDYALRESVPWFVLTNARQWRVYRVPPAPADEIELVAQFDLTRIDAANTAHLRPLFLLTKEGCARNALAEHREWRHALAPGNVSAALLSEPVVNLIRRELKHLSPSVRIEFDDVRDVIRQDVIPASILTTPQFSEAAAALAAVRPGAPEPGPAVPAQP